MDGGFADRLHAGERLADALIEYQGTDSVVLGMARGGVVVGFAVAERLDISLRALVVRKLGAPQNPELAIGAVSETGAAELDPELVRATGATREYVEAEIQRQIREARRREQEYHVGSSLDIVAGKTAIVVDDGIATGASALVAVKSARQLDAGFVVMAAPVASRQAVTMLRLHADRVVVLAEPEPFMAVGLYYRHFDQVSDGEVVHYLEEARNRGSE
ncbi:MAG TPA: phosphoribosyltransferase family protein [Chloroflexota bacterium]|nr:phosphoribosyltransferase family protein [Chloroflexota bacterium]